MLSNVVGRTGGYQNPRTETLLRTLQGQQDLVFDQCCITNNLSNTSDETGSKEHPSAQRKQTWGIKFPT